MRSLPRPEAAGCGYRGTCGCASVVRRSPGLWNNGSQISDPTALPETSTYASKRVVFTLPEAAGCEGNPPPKAAGCEGKPPPKAAGCEGNPPPKAAGCEGNPPPEAAGCEGNPPPEAAGCKTRAGV